jgi:hypothetical protein
MPTKTTGRPTTAGRPAPPGRERDGLGLPGLAEALEVYRRIAAQGGGVRLRPARRRPPAAVSG